MNVQDRLQLIVPIMMLAFSCLPIFSQEPLPQAMLKEFLGTPNITRAETSPDGSTVVYIVRKDNPIERSKSQELFLQHLESNGSAADEPVSIIKITCGEPSSCYVINVTWDDNSRYVDAGYAPGPALAASPELKPGERLRYDIRSGKTSILRAVGPVAVKDPDHKPGPNARPAITTLPLANRPSPSGRFAAFTSIIRPAGKESPPTAVVLTPTMLRTNVDFSTPERKGLFVFDTTTGIVRQITPDDMNVETFSWSPDEKELAFSGYFESDIFDPIYCEQISRSDIFAIDLATRTPRRIVRQPGEDTAVAWSPDGKWIAFKASFEHTYISKGIAVVPSQGGTVIRLTGGESSGMTWAGDGQSLFYKSELRMGEGLRKVDLHTRKVVTMVQPDEKSNIGTIQIPTGNRRQVAFLRQSVVAPSEVFVKDLVSGTEHQVSRIGQGRGLSELVRRERVNWKSSDGKFTVEGLLLTPKSAWKGNGSTPVRPLPTLTWIKGGPSMVRDEFYESEIGHAIIMAAYGYAVFVPNPRGRGGYGASFQNLLNSDGSGYGKLPYQDVMSGIDSLITKGIANPHRLGIYGHSAGGYLTSYALTRTNRFKAGINIDGWVNLAAEAVRRYSDGGAGCLYREAFGMRNPYDPIERDQLIEQTPMFNTHKITTPYLLLSSSIPDTSALNANGRPMEAGLRRHGIPSELVLYNDRHSFSKFPSKVDTLARIVEWFDYWVRGIATERLAARYGLPKNAENVAGVASTK